MKANVWIKIAVSVGLLAWFLAGADLQRLRAHLAGIPSGEGLLIVGLLFAAWLVNTAKWKILLGGHSFLRLFALTLIGQFYALVLPGQIAGEAVKAWKLIGRNADSAKVVTSILMDRLTGVICLLLVGLLGASLTAAATGETWAAAFGVSIIVFGLAAWLVRLPPMQTWSRNVLTFVGRRIPRAAGLSETGIRCIDAWIDYLGSPVRLLQAIVLGLAFQCLAVAMVHRIGIGIGVPVAFVDWCWIFAAVSLLLLLPVTVGGIGLREGAFVALLAGFGVTSEKALACSLALFAVQILAAAAGGVLDVVLIVRRGPRA